MRLIDADALKKEFKKSPFITGAILSCVRRIIDKAPTIEITLTQKANEDTE